MNFDTKEEKMAAIQALQETGEVTDAPSAFNDEMNATLNATVDGEVDSNQS